MENEAKGVEVIVSGKLRSQRAKAMKFCDGYALPFIPLSNSLLDT